MYDWKKYYYYYWQVIPYPDWRVFIPTVNFFKNKTILSIPKSHHFIEKRRGIINDVESRMEQLKGAFKVVDQRYKGKSVTRSRK
ncbi:MAG: hypothetical protein ABIL45_04670 [candidate division WOR-3 bacterium]|jgi:hypothetical protein